MSLLKVLKQFICDFKSKKRWSVLILVSYQWQRKVQFGPIISEHVLKHKHTHAHTHKHKDMHSLVPLYALSLCLFPSFPPRLSSSYPFLAVPPESSHRQFEEQPAAPARRHSRLDHHAPRLTERVCATGRVCLLSRSRQTFSVCPPLRLHGSLLFQTDAVVPRDYMAV